MTKERRAYIIQRRRTLTVTALAALGLVALISIDNFINDFNTPIEAQTREHYVVVEPQRVLFEVTAYSNETGMNNDGVTASGEKAEVGTMGAPTDLPFGTEVQLEPVDSDLTGFETMFYKVADRGPELKTYINANNETVYVVSIWMDSTEKANEFGRRTMYGSIIK